MLLYDLHASPRTNHPRPHRAYVGLLCYATQPDEMNLPDMAFEFVNGGDEPMYAGQTIAYKVTIMPGVRVRWLMQIIHMEPGRCFIDEQRLGPYRLWIHEPRFERLPPFIKRITR